MGMIREHVRHLVLLVIWFLLDQRVIGARRIGFPG